MDHAGAKPVVVGAIDLERGMRSDRRPVVETGRRDKLGVLTAASRADRGERSIGVLVGAHNRTLREGGNVPAGSGDGLDLRHLQGQITRVLDRKAQSSACAVRRILRVIRDEYAVGIGHPCLNPHGEARGLALSSLPKALLISLECIDGVGRSDTNDEDSERRKHAEQKLLFHFTPRRELTALRESGGRMLLKQATAGQTFGYQVLHRQALSDRRNIRFPGSASDSSLAQMGQIYLVSRTGGKHSFTG